MPNLDEKIISILVERIQNGKTNPITGHPFKLEDIKIDAYRQAVSEKLTPKEDSNGTTL